MPTKRAAPSEPQITDAVIGPDVDLDVEDIRLADGSRLTNERAEQLVEEFRADAERRGAGRPSLSGGRKHSPQITFRVPDEVLARALEVAAAEGKSLSQLAREALEERVRA